MWKENKIIFLGFIFSLVLLITFFALQWFESNLLSLDTKWIAFSGLPILIALLIGGYIKSFKGFGIEVEANLNKPISKNYNLITKLESEEVPKYIKGSIREIQRLSSQQRRKIKRLTFIYGKKDYYGEEAINEYLNHLPNLEYIEITDSKRKFKYLLPIQILKEGGDNLNWETEHRFIKALENRNIPSEYPNLFESKTVKSDEPVFEVYKKLKITYPKTIPIVNTNNEMIGLVDYYKVAIQIADEIVDLKNKS